MSSRDAKKRAKLIKNNYNPYSELIKEYANVVNPEKIKHMHNICLEIGSGSGKFLSQYSKSSNLNCLGIELRYKRIVYAAEKDGKALWCRLNVEKIFDYLPNNELKEVHIYFPDPWPKEREHKKRLMSEQFLAKLHSFMAADSLIYFKTDHDEYFEFALGNLERHFEILERDRDYYSTRELGLSSEFENLFYKQGVKIKYALAKKKAS